MCDHHSRGEELSFAGPGDLPTLVGHERLALVPADGVDVTIVVDGEYDAQLPQAEEYTTRPKIGELRKEQSPLFRPSEPGNGNAIYGLRAEQGYSALVTVYMKGAQHRILFDTGISDDGLVNNAKRLGLAGALGGLTAVQISHGHYDHVGGLAELRRQFLDGKPLTPLVLHPHAWRQRRTRKSDGKVDSDFPTLDAAAVANAGFEIVKAPGELGMPGPSLRLDDCVLITGEVPRRTLYERGWARHEALVEGEWQPDPWICDDQGLVVHVRGLGLVVITGCGHAGAVNTVRWAMELTGVTHVCALIGGFHLSSPEFHHIIEPTVRALADLHPRLIAPGHCSGWRARRRLYEALPYAYRASSVGTTFSFGRKA